MRDGRNSNDTRVVVRTDASRLIGTGHVMRTLSLAVQLRRNGAEVEFITRGHQGHLTEHIQKQGFRVFQLPHGNAALESAETEYERWLGVPWEADAQETAQALETNPPDWLVVDHYGLDERWERQLQCRCRAILVVDDLAERRHACDLLLDQSLPTAGWDRSRLLSPNSELLSGPRYALLPAAFRKAREELLRVRDYEVRRLVLFFGGSDLTNETGKALSALETFPPGSFEVDVVAGALNRNVAELESQCKRLNYRLHIGGADMASLYAPADLALGAGGSSSWERMCLGLPSLTVAVAENQERIGKALAESGGALYLGRSQDVTAATYAAVLRALRHLPEELKRQSLRGMQLVDGRGASRVAAAMMNQSITRPGYGPEAEYWDRTQGKRVRNAVPAGTPISRELL